MLFRRYGLYYAPNPGGLASFGAAWLGWDLAAGVPVSHPTIDNLPAQVSELTAAPRKYGLHATIKPPFVLADGTTETQLNQTVADLCRRVAAFDLGGLELTSLAGFLALQIIGDQTPVNMLAAEAVRVLDAFRAPASDTEMARRRRAHLTPTQDALLRQWGYPYVMQEFRFHITLTGRLGKNVDATRAALAPVIAPFLPCPFRVDSLTLVGEDDVGMFHEICRHRLTG